MFGHKWSIKPQQVVYEDSRTLKTTLNALKRLLEPDFPFQMFRSELYGGSNSQSKYEVEMYFRQSAPARI